MGFQFASQEEKDALYAAVKSDLDRKYGHLLYGYEGLSALASSNTCKDEEARRKDHEARCRG